MSSRPRKIGRYELLERIARGGQGEVWKALDTQLQRTVAIKLLPPDLSEDMSEFSLRFEREAQLIAALRHPNIVRVHDFRITRSDESEENLAYMVMEYVPGETLAGYIRNTSKKGMFPTWSEVVSVFADISFALDYAHSHGVIHRDIKPANILLDKRLPTSKPPGKGVLFDFGIARAEHISTRTLIGALLGTPLYISPEQALGDSSDWRSDLYSLGVVLYEVMTGETPFRGDTTSAILMQHVHDAPRPPLLLNAKITPEASGVITKSLAKKPEDRFSSAGEMTAALAQALNVSVPGRLLSSTTGLISAPSSLLHAPPGGHPSQVIYRPGDTPGGAANYGARPIDTSGGRITPDQQSIALTTGGYSPVSNTPEANVGGFPSLDVPPTLLAPEQREEQAKSKRKKRVLLASLLLLVALVLGSGSLFLLLSGGNPVVGQIQFKQSPSAPAGNYDLIEVNLKNISDLQAGQIYFAWIEPEGQQIELPRWRLSVQGQSVQATFSGQKNLLLPNSLFLVTRETTDNPVVPHTTARAYYASITSNTITTFEVKQCPDTDTDNPCLGVLTA